MYFCHAVCSLRCLIARWKAAKRGPERAGDHKVGASAAHAAVRDERREGRDGQIGERLAEDEDGERAEPAHHAYGEADKEEERRTKDIEQAGNEHAVERP